MSQQAAVLRKRILLTDDQPEVRGVIRVMLDLDEHIVTEAGNGREALTFSANGSTKSRWAPGGRAATAVRDLPKGTFILALAFTAQPLASSIGPRLRRRNLSTSTIQTNQTNWPMMETSSHKALQVFGRSLTAPDRQARSCRGEEE